MYLIRRNKRLVKLVSGVSLIVSLIVIISATILSRQRGSYTVHLALLSQFWVEDYDLDTAIRPMLMNVFLFLPFGMSLSYMLPDRLCLKTNWILVAASAFLLSLLLETAQYCLLVGNFETDDILCNTVGALLGMVPLAIQTESKKRRS